MALNFWRLIRFVPVWRGQNRSDCGFKQGTLTKRSHWNRNKRTASGSRFRSAGEIRKRPSKLTRHNKTAVKSYITLVNADPFQCADKKRAWSHDDCVSANRQGSQTVVAQSTVDRIYAQLCDRQLMRRIKWPDFLKIRVERWMRTRLFAGDGQIRRHTRE
jgi:hypothetical protein